MENASKEISTTGIVYNWLMTQDLGKEITSVELATILNCNMNNVSASLSSLVNEGMLETAGERALYNDKGQLHGYVVYKLVKKYERPIRAKPIYTKPKRMHPIEENVTENFPRPATPRVFVSNSSYKFETDKLLQYGEVIEVCKSPVFEDFVGLEHTPKFEGRIKDMMHDFDAENDYVACFGDPLITSMMIFYLSSIVNKIKILRYSKKSEGFILREIGDHTLDLD